jgi:DNA-binding NarL/FixJ family response regulator
MAITVSIIEDDAGTLETLAQLIDGWPPLVCVSRHARAANALAQIPALKPHVIITDLELGKSSSGVDCIRVLREKLPKTPILVYTQHDHGKWVFPALREGASGYLLKSEGPSTLLDGIHAAHRGESPMSAVIAREVLGYFREQRDAAREVGKLTERQTEILDLASRGARDSDIGEKLGISVRTVGAHFRQIYETLHAKCRAEAVAKFAAASPTPQAVRGLAGNT